MKVKLKAINNKLNNAEEGSNKLPGRQNNGNHPIRTADRKTNTERKKEKSNIWDLWDNIKHVNLCIIRLPEGEER